MAEGVIVLDSSHGKKDGFLQLLSLLLNKEVHKFNIKTTDPYDCCGEVVFHPFEMPVPPNKTSYGTIYTVAKMGEPYVHNAELFLYTLFAKLTIGASLEYLRIIWGESYGSSECGKAPKVFFPEFCVLNGKKYEVYVIKIKSSYESEKPHVKRIRDIFFFLSETLLVTLTELTEPPPDSKGWVTFDKEATKRAEDIIQNGIMGIELTHAQKILDGIKKDK